MVILFLISAISFSQGNIKRSIKTLSMFFIYRNEKDSVNGHANKIIGKTHHDRYDYIREEHTMTLK